MTNISKILLLVVIALFFRSSALPVFATDILEPWQNSTNLDDTYVSNQSVVYNNRIYLLGGTANQGSTRSNVRSNSFLPNGSLSLWSNQPSLNNSLIWHSSTLINNRIYIIGGFEEPPGVTINSISYADINVSGNAGPWINQASDKLLPKALGLGSTARVGDYVFYLGGATWPGVSLSSDIYKSEISGNNLGAWQDANLDLPTPLAAHGSFVSGNKIYVLGGSTNNSFAPTNKVYVYEVNLSNGDLTRLTDEENLPVSSRTAMITKLDDYVIHAGGVTGPGAASNQVYFAPIDSSGNIGVWELSSQNLPLPNCCTAITTNGDYVYIIGGHDNQDPYYNSVIYTKLNLGPSLPDLSVPDIKQYSPPWHDDIYDHATSWTNNPTINRWGCALTSAAMVLQYHGHTSTNPDTLNNWLQSQTDGYIRNGLVNWLAISRYTRLHDSPSSPTLEYRRLGSSSEELVSELTANRPAILEQPNHFIVAKSQTDSSFGINDPGYSDRSTLASYGNTFQSIRSYKPTHTDLSYISLVVNNNVDIQVTDENSLVVGEVFIEQPIQDDIDGSKFSGQSLKVFQLPTPSAGVYKVVISGNSSYTLDAYLYDEEGNVVQNSIKGLVSNNNSDEYLITIGDQPTTIQKTTLDQIIKDLDAAFLSKKINIGKYVELKLYLQSAKTLIKNKLPKQAKKSLDSAIKLLDKSTPKFIDQTTSSVLKYQIQILIASL